MAKDNMMLWIMGIILLVALLYVSQPKEGVGLVVHYYKNGEEVFPQKSLFSIVTPGGVFDQISFDIMGSSDAKISNIKIINVSPIEFKNALPTTTQNLSEETKKLWTSGLINTSSLEKYPQPVKFWINVSGFDEFKKKIVSTEYSTEISFKPEVLNLIVNAKTITLGGVVEYGLVEVKNGGVIQVDTAFGYLDLTANTIIIDSTSKIDGKKRGAIGGIGGSMSNGGRCGNCGGGGSIGFGASGGKGGGTSLGAGSGGGGGVSSLILGNETDINYFIGYSGSGGGGGGGACGDCDTNQQSGPGVSGNTGERGGAGIRLSALTIVINGAVDVSGGNGGIGGRGGNIPSYDGCWGGGGGGGGGTGGSAGSIVIKGGNIDISMSTINLLGGIGGNGGGGGAGNCGRNGGAGAKGADGKGGRLKVFYSSLDNSGIILNLGNGGTAYYKNQ